MVPPLPLLQGIAHLEREKHKILDDDDREQASVNLLKRWQHQKYQCCYQELKSGILRRSRKQFSNLSQCSGRRGKIQGGRSAGFSAGRNISEKNTDVNNVLFLDSTIDKKRYSPTPLWGSSSSTRWTPSLVSESAAASPVNKVFLTRHNEETNHSRKYVSKQDPILMKFINLHSPPPPPNHHGQN